MKVKDIMDVAPTIVPITGTFTTLVETLGKIRFHIIFVVDEEEKLAGVITEGDLLKVLMPKYLEAGDALFSIMDEDYFDKKCIECKDLNIRDIMWKKVVTVNEEDTIIKAASVMLNYRIHSVPVVKNEKVIGLVSHLILLRHMTKVISKK